MEENDKVVQLIARLVAGTEAGAIGWRATSDENAFRIVSKIVNINIHK
jgi:hypothetical protein